MAPQGHASRRLPGGAFLGRRNLGRNPPRLRMGSEIGRSFPIHGEALFLQGSDWKVRWA
jgi:hypothetical protein